MKESIINAYRDVCYENQSRTKFVEDFTKLWNEGAFDDCSETAVVTSTRHALVLTECEMMTDLFKRSSEDESKKMAERLLEISEFHADVSTLKKAFAYIRKDPEAHIPYVILKAWTKDYCLDYDELYGLKTSLTIQEAVTRYSKLFNLDDGWIESMARRKARKMKRNSDVPVHYLAGEISCPTLDASKYQEAAEKVCRTYILENLVSILADKSHFYPETSLKAVAQSSVMNMFAEKEAEIQTACSWAYVMMCMIDANRKSVRDLLELVMDAGNVEDAEKQMASLAKENKELRGKIDEQKKKNSQKVKELEAQLSEIQTDRDNGKVKYLKEVLEKEKRKNAELEKKVAEYKEFQKAVSQEEPVPDVLPEVDMTQRYMFVVQDAKMKPKLHEWFPNCVISEGREVTGGYYMVIFITKSISHTEYFRVKKKCESKNIPYVNCNRIAKEAVIQAIAARMTRAPFA